ncbi:hypothetical protein [Pantoea agglomerans]|uniref:hypothetical protein n=1 Tax=Enterobacter agglomerans TaxID=549 RepID=UPI0012DA644F|nr:hypothetical protein [Pantoea agglomerans]WHU86712.1 hypothetical protein A7P62_12500 [Pantoea agglomerans pv. gypsophilae]
MILFKLKNLIVDSFSSLGLTVISPKTINSDALPYILYLTNCYENNTALPMGRNTTSEFTFDVVCTSKSLTDNQTVMQTVYDYITSEQFILDANVIPVRISTVTNTQTQDDFDPATGLNTIVISMSVNYITLAR